MTDKEVMQMALTAFEVATTNFSKDKQEILAAQEALRVALAQPEPVLADIEQYRLQMAAISTAAIGYWKQGDGIRPEYDTLALRDVTTLYEKYAALHKTQPERAECDGGQCGIGGYCKQCPKTQPEPEPVAWFTEDHRADKSATTYSKKMAERWKEKGWPVTPLYTSPPQREWVGLTDEEINILFKNSLKSIPTGVIWNISRTIEAKLKEKNT